MKKMASRSEPSSLLLTYDMTLIALLAGLVIDNINLVCRSILAPLVYVERGKGGGVSCIQCSNGGSGDTPWQLELLLLFRPGVILDRALNSL